MADKKVDATTGEVKEQEEKFQYFERPKLQLDDDLDAQDNKCFVGIKVHCKPVYNYQSVEFDWVIPFDKYCKQQGMDDMEAFYTKMLEMLVRVSQNAPQVEAKKPVAPVEEPATEAQKQILRNFHIDFKPDITKKQAHNLIKKSMDQEVF
jgi:hypothetical protein